MTRQTSTLLQLLMLVFLANCQTLSHSAQKNKLSSIPLPKRIDAILGNQDPRAKIGIQMVSMKSDKILYEKNANQLFTPASTLKLYTAAAALHYLGPSYRFETKALTDQFSKNGIRNLYIQGSGDPSFSANDLAKIALVLKQFNVKNILGDVIIDENQFDGVRWGAGWMWDDMHKGFSAPIGALNVDYNRIVVYARPGDKIGEPVKVRVEPFTQFVKIVVSAKTSKANGKSSLSIGLTPPDQKTADSQQPMLGLTKNQIIYVSGSLPQNKTLEYKTFSVKDPSVFAGYILKEQLQKHGVRIAGTVKLGDVPPDAFVIDTVVSRSLSEAIVDFVKISNNQATEVLLKTIGLKQAGPPGTFESGITATKEFLKNEVHIDAKGLVNADGSGLSRYSLTSPSQMTQLLRYMWRNFNSGPEFISALPIAGEDGTLNGRWQNSALRGRIRAKSGTMSNVCSLVGYLFGDDDEVLSFAIMINGHAMERSACRQLIEDLLSAASQGSIN